MKTLLVFTAGFWCGLIVEAAILVYLALKARGFHRKVSDALNEGLKQWNASRAAEAASKSTTPRVH